MADYVRGGLRPSSALFPFVIAVGVSHRKHPHRRHKRFSGDIRIGGVALGDVREDDLMEHVVLVRHNSYLFKGTVEENLRMAKPDATKEEMEAVLQKVNLLGFLQTQDGLQTQLLEKASNLSGGQCQRLVIARAFASDRQCGLYLR